MTKIKRSKARVDGPFEVFALDIVIFLFIDKAFLYSVCEIIIVYKSVNL